MELFPTLLLVSFIGGIVAMDTAAAWQIMISQPVVACPLLGWLLGDVELGLTIGILLELPWLINI
ncbi:MAG: PTS sugar transporter subunit IIC, partial [candidate division KSB1 bacterium]|nr:PTS sugar transporter subunit IIC [candidate division KSB1 bacterium]